MIIKHNMTLKKILPVLAILTLIATGFYAAFERSTSALTFVWIVLFFFGLYMGIDSLLYAFRSYQSRQWPTTPFKLENDSIGKRRDEHHTFYTVFGDLVYTVEGQIYTKDLRDDYNAAKFNDHAAAESYLSSIKQSPIIYYNPMDPADSRLRPGISLRAIAAFIVGFGFSVIAVLSFIDIIKWR